MVRRNLPRRQAVHRPILRRGGSVSIDNNRVVNIIQLQKDICAEINASSWNAAQFAMEMIEGVQKVNFMITDSSNTESDNAEEFAYY